VQPGDVRGGLEAQLPRPKESGEGLEGPLDVVEIGRQGRKMPVLPVTGPRHQKGDFVHFTGQLCLAPCDEDLPQFEELEIRRAGVDVASHRLKQAVEKRRPHDGLVFRQRIGDPDEAAPLVALGEPEGVGRARRDKAVIERLREPQAVQGISDGGLELPLAVVEISGHGNGRHRHGDLVEAVDPGDLLDEVDLPPQIDAEGGRGDGQDALAFLFDGHLEALEDGRRLGGLHGRAEDRLHAIQSDLDGPRDGDLAGVRVDETAADAAARQVGDELRGPVEGPHDALGVDSPLEPECGIGPHAEKPRAAADRRRVEVRALEQHRLRVVLDLGVLAAHDPGNGHGLAAVADHQRLGVQGPGLAVEGDEGLALPRAADDDPPFLEESEIEGVQGLPELHHDEVRHVNDVVDGPEPHGLEALPHPLRGGLDLHSLDHAGRVPGAEVGVENLNGGDRPDILPGLLEGDLRVAELPAAQDGRLSRDPDDAEAVGPVRRDPDVEHRVP